MQMFRRKVSLLQQPAVIKMEFINVLAEYVLIAAHWMENFGS